MSANEPSRRLLLVLGVGGLATGCRNGSSPPTVGPTKPLSENASAKKDIPVSAIKPTGEKEFAYTIELQQPGGSKRVRENYLFRSGDGFRVLFKPGFTTYIYLFNRGPRGGRFQRLFPSKFVKLSNPVRSGEDAAIPDDPKIWMRLDQHAGEENFIIVASTIALPELEGSPSIAPDRPEYALANTQRRYAPQSSRRFEDGDWVKIFAADGGKDVALILRVPLKHT